MSGLLAGKVWLSALDPELKPLAATLADIGDDDGTSIYPSVAYVAWRLGRSERSVQSGMAQLRALGILEVVRLGGGRGKSTEYVLREAALPERPTWTEERNGANSAGFEKGADHDKGCNPRHERVKHTAPDPLLTVITGNNSGGRRGKGSRGYQSQQMRDEALMWLEERYRDQSARRLR